MRYLAICDDDPDILARLQRMAEEYFVGDCRTRTFPGGAELKKALAGGYRPEIVFMDIVLNGQNGIQLVQELFPDHFGAEVIFVTGYAEYCTDVYEANHIYFLLKPVLPEKLYMALDKAQKMLRASESSAVTIRVDGTLRRVFLSDIRYLESRGRKLLAYLNGETIGFYGTLTEYAGLLGPSFLQCHKSFLVNMNEIRSVQTDCFELFCGACVPISHKRYAESKAAFLDFLNKQMGV
jgi:DNA-binding LytR/AlgR family response regulator